MDPLSLSRLTYFAAVAETRSFTAAAERLGVGKAVVSQQVARLEEGLQATLLLRTTRRVTLTEAGERLYARCQVIFREAAEAVEEAADTNAEPQGVLRVAASQDLGTGTVAAVAAAFTRRYPACTVDLAVSDARTDPVAEQTDVAVRVGWLDDSSHQARRIGTFRQWVVAAPGVGEASVPEDLAALPFIANTAMRDPLNWVFRQGEAEHPVRMRPAMTISSTLAVLSAALAGGGVTVLPDFLVAAAVRDGRLQVLLPDWTLPVGGIHVVFPAARFRPQKVTQFVAMLSTALKEEGGR